MVEVRENRTNTIYMLVLPGFAGLKRVDGDIDSGAFAIQPGKLRLHITKSAGNRFGVGVITELLSVLFCAVLIVVEGLEYKLIGFSVQPIEKPMGFYRIGLKRFPRNLSGGEVGCISSTPAALVCVPQGT